MAPDSTRRRDPRLLFVGGLIALAAIAGLVAVLASGGDEGEEVVNALPPGCEVAEAPEPKDVSLERPPLEAPPVGTEVVMATNCGEFTITLDSERAPKTSASFVHMVEQGLYEGTPFHRVAPAFVVQAGDPQGDGTGGPGYFVDEPPPDGLVYDRGLVAMAKSGAEPPGRSGSQFFVVTAPADAGLPPDYALLGRVTAGFDTIERIEAAGQGTGTDGPPKAPVVISSATVSS